MAVEIAVSSETICLAAVRVQYLALQSHTNAVRRQGTAGCERHNALNDSTVCTYGCAVEHALMVGQSGEKHARLAIESDGSILFGDDGEGAFDTTLRRHISRTVDWDRESQAHRAHLPCGADS